MNPLPPRTQPATTARILKSVPAIALGTILLAISGFAEVEVPSIFSNHMVLQQGIKNRIWGWADAGERVTVLLGDQRATNRAGSDGRWEVALDPMPAGGPHTLRIMGKNTLVLEDVLVGEVWLCSGQSNMQLAVNTAKDPDLEKLTADYPEIRLITVPQVGTQEPQRDFRGQWEPCSPATVGNFSAVGYYFGRQLYQTLRVPIGLIDNSWGGSSAEAWVRRDLLEADERYKPLLDRWTELEESFDFDQALQAYKTRLGTWEVQAAEARAKGQPVPNRPRRPGNPLAGQHRPGNLYNGVLKPILGYGIKGVIWYQGESNAGRAYQYRHLFPLMIQNWRDEWGLGDFPFYWVQLADFRDEKAEPGDSDWAELREAQTMTMSKLPSTGEAVIINLGEAHNIHPKDKQDVGKRLARWALAKQYGYDMVYRSPIYRSMDRQGNKIVVTFDHVGGGLNTFDVRTPIGFSIAGVDQKFHWAKARIASKTQIEVWSDEVADPVAVRYAWADNPVCNLQNREGLPLTPFRTDDWPGITINHQR